MPDCRALGVNLYAVAPSPQAPVVDGAVVDMRIYAIDLRSWPADLHLCRVGVSAWPVGMHAYAVDVNAWRAGMHA
jgi:hypothetical protein